MFSESPKFRGRRSARRLKVVAPVIKVVGGVELVGTGFGVGMGKATAPLIKVGGVDWVGASVGVGCPGDGGST